MTDSTTNPTSKPAIQSLIQPTVAYFSVQIALDPAMPTYSGGLGILAGDTLRAAADLSVPMIAVTLLHRRGYLSQTIDQDGWQHESPVDWNVDGFCSELPTRVEVCIEGRKVLVRAWRFDVVGCGGHVNPVLLLDTDLHGNSSVDRALTQQLYGGDERRRLCQEVVLGIGGIRTLRSLQLSELRSLPDWLARGQCQPTRCKPKSVMKKLIG